MKTKWILSILIIPAAFCLSQSARSQSIDLVKARQYFSEAEKISTLDNGEMWGIPLYGPLVFIDEKSRQGVANQKVPIDGWVEDHGLYFGTMPEKMGFANTALDWNGQAWSMIIFSHLSENPKERASLMMHELLHQHEKSLGLLSDYESSDHLDKKMGRVTLFLEWNALLKACHSEGEEMKTAVRDAISFRLHRYGAFPDARKNETGLELHEGIAEYTGMVLSGWNISEKLNFLDHKVSSRDASGSLTWMFGYTSGVLYGYLLDRVSPGWTRQLKKGFDLGELLAKTLVLPYDTSHHEYNKISARLYGSDSIMPSEELRESKTLAIQLDYKTRFQQDPTLFLPRINLQIQFSPGKITPFEGVGTVYGSLTAQDCWGGLQVSSGDALLLNGWKGLVLPLEKGWTPDQGLKTKNWTLELSPGYAIIRKDQGWTIDKKHP